MKKELTVPKNGALEVKGNEDLKHGGMTEEEFILPRLKLLKDDKNGLPAGSLINKVTGQLFESLFVPVFAFNTYIKFNGMTIEWISTDRTDPKVDDGLKWKEGTRGEKIKPTVTQVMNFVGFPSDNLSMPVVVGFKRTSLKSGKAFYTTCYSNSRGTVPVEGTHFNQFKVKHRYNIFGRKVEDKNYGSYHTLDFSLPKDPEQFNIQESEQPVYDSLAKTAAFLVNALSADAYEVEADEPLNV